MNTRALASLILDEVIHQQKSLTQVFAERFDKQFDKHYNKMLNTNDIALIKELVFGVLRYYTRLNKLADNLLKKPFKKKDRIIHILILVGLYQLSYLRIPDHAAVFETVQATKQLNQHWAVPLMNGILRRFSREEESLIKQFSDDTEYQYAHPMWLIKQIKKAWPDDWIKVLEHNNHHPPMTLRINTLKTNREHYLEKLQHANIAAYKHPDITTAVTLQKALPAQQLPGFEGGGFFIQDAGAQIAASLLTLKPGQRVLDACAAPGGKTTHILEQQPNINELIAIDIDPKRIAKIEENYRRLQLARKAEATLTLLAGDVNDTDRWWDGNRFDRILLDVPCSATGVIRRHPDIKILRKQTDILLLAKQQLNLLMNLWPLLADDGLLVYATCSLFPEENENVIAAFLKEKNTAKECQIHANWGRKRTHGRQILPGDAGDMDGFYYACLNHHVS